MSMQKRASEVDYQMGKTGISPHWHRVLGRWTGWARGKGKIPAILLALAALGLAKDGWRAVQGVWQELNRPIAVYRRAIREGLAISLNGLEKQQERVGPLPGLDIRGVLLDRSQNDWILFGEANPERPRLPLDAVAIALRAIRLHLDAPGIDIQPQPSASGEGQPVQEVRYFGGVKETVVGKWFFRFDYWMKRASLGKEPAPISGMPVYWRRAIEALQREVETCQMTGPAARIRRNRYWLCTENFEAIEGDDTLVFQRTPLRVLTESLHAGEMAGTSPKSASRDTDDPHAAEFANWLTEHLADLSQVVPVSQIADFAQILAGLAWLAEMAPYRDLSPWLNAPLTPVDTPTTVPTLVRHAVREHIVTKNGALVKHQHRLELSGGVLVHPSLTRARVGDDSLLLLHRAVLTARPAGKPVVWAFRFSPPSN